MRRAKWTGGQRISSDNKSPINTRYRSKKNRNPKQIGNFNATQYYREPPAKVRRYVDLKANDMLIHRTDESEIIQITEVLPSGKLVLKTTHHADIHTLQQNQCLTIGDGRKIVYFGKRKGFGGQRAHVGLYSTDPNDNFYNILRGENWKSNGNVHTDE